MQYSNFNKGNTLVAINPVLWIAPQENSTENIFSSFDASKSTLSKIYEILDADQINIDGYQDNEASEHIILIDNNTPNAELLVRAIAWKVLSINSSKPEINIVQTHYPLSTYDREQLINAIEGNEGKFIESGKKSFKDFCAEFNKTYIDDKGKEHPCYPITEANEIKAYVDNILVNNPINQVIELASLRLRIPPYKYKPKEFDQFVEQCQMNLETKFQQEIDKRNIPQLSIFEKAKQEIEALTIIEDKIEYCIKANDICSRYRITKIDLENIIRQIKAKNDKSELEILSIRELYDSEDESIDWLVDGLIPQGETLILTAAPKDGKSILSINLAFSVATGDSKFLGRETKKGKVLLICPDASKRSLRNQLKRKGLVREDENNLDTLSKFKFEDLFKLDEKLEKYDLVIIDSLHSITSKSGISENSQEFGHLIIELRDVIERHNSTLILIHHNNKSSELQGINKVRGTSATASNAWGVIIMSRIAENGKIDQADSRRNIQFIGREIETQNIVVDLNLEDYTFEEIDLPEKPKKVTYKKKIIDLLKQYPNGLIGKKIMEGLKATKSIYNELSDLVDNKTIYYRKNPKNKREKIYFIKSNNHNDVPLPPTDIEQKGDYHSETLTVQGIDNSHLNSHINEVTNKVTNKGDYLNVDTARDTEDSHVSRIEKSKGKSNKMLENSQYHDIEDKNPDSPKENNDNSLKNPFDDGSTQFTEGDMIIYSGTHKPFERKYSGYLKINYISQGRIKCTKLNTLKQLWIECNLNDFRIVVNPLKRTT